MNEITKIGQTMTSREIADLLESRHDKVKQSIERLAERGVIQHPPVGEVKNHLGQTVSEYLIGKRDSYVIVAQLSPEFTARLVDRWQELESAPAASLPDFTNPVIAARAWADKAEQCLLLEKTVVEQAPKIAALSRISAAEGVMCITDAAKTLQEQPKTLFGWLQTNQWIYRRPGGATWTAYQDKIQRGVLEHKITTVQRPDGSEKVTTQVLVTAKGVAELAQKFMRADLH